MSSLVDLAKTISRTAHTGQKYGDQDYFDYHICGVVNSLINSGFTDEDIIITAYLHDSLEDTNVEYSTLENLFGWDIAIAVFYLTKQEKQSRQEYLAECKQVKTSRIVKLHDAFFNLNNCLLNKNKSKANYYIDTISKLKLD